MKNLAFSKIWVIVVLIIFVVGGFFVWQYFESPEKRIKDETADWKTYKNSSWGYEIRYPSSFELLPEPKENIMIGNEVAESEPADWWNKALVKVMRQLNNKDLPLEEFVSRLGIYSREPNEILINGRKALKQTSYDPYEIMIYLARNDGYMYIIQGLSGIKEDTQKEQLINKIADTFKFTEKAEALPPTGVEPAKKTGWWRYKNTKYKYIVEFPDESSLKDCSLEWPSDGRIFGTSSCVFFYLEGQDILNYPKLSIKIPVSYTPEEIKLLSKEEFIKRFVTVDLWSDNYSKEKEIFNLILSTFKFWE